LMQQGSQSAKWMQNRWATRSQTERRFSINLDEAIAEQWQQTYG
jgi:hypothetical protein